MNNIKAIDGKLYLMPERKEIPIDSVMGILAIIRAKKDHISYLNEQLKAEQKELAPMEVLEKKGIKTAIDSARHYRKDIEETERALFRFNKELEDYEFTLEIAREKEKRTIMQEELEKLLNDRRTVKQTKNKPPLTLIQVALIHVYKGIQITRENGKSIAEKAGFTSDTSGEKLYQNYSKFCKANNRKGDAGNERKNRNKVNLIESIIHLLPPDTQQRAKDEVEVLKKIIETQ